MFFSNVLYLLMTLTMPFRWHTFGPSPSFADGKVCIARQKLQFYVGATLSLSRFSLCESRLKGPSLPTRFSSGNFTILIHLLNIRVGEGSLSPSFILPHWAVVPAALGESESLGRGFFCFGGFFVLGFFWPHHTRHAGS